MKGKSGAIFFLIAAALFLCPPAFLSSQNPELGVGLYPGESSTRKQFKQRTLSEKENSFANRAAEHFSIDKKEIEKLLREGFYKKEIVRILIISKKSSTPFERVVLMRKKRTNFADICKKLMVDHKAVTSEADEFLAKI